LGVVFFLEQSLAELAARKLGFVCKKFFSLGENVKNEIEKDKMTSRRSSEYLRFL